MEEDRWTKLNKILNSGMELVFVSIATIKELLRTEIAISVKTLHAKK